MDQTPITRTVRAAFWDYAALLAGRGLAIGLMLLVMGLITRLLGREGFGRFSVFLLVGQFFFLLSVNWTGASVVRFGREEFLQTGNLGRTFWARNLILTVCMTLAGIVIIVFRRSLLSYIGVPELSVWMLILYLTVFTANNYSARLLQATENLRFHAFANSVSHAAAALGLVVVFVCIGPPYRMTAVIIAYLLGKCASALYGFVRCGPKSVRPLVLDAAVLKRILLFSCPLIVGTLCGYVVGSIDIFIIKRYMAESEVGIYALAYQGITVLREVPLAAMILAVPIVLTFRTEKKDHLARRYVDTVIPGAGFIWGLLLVPVVFASRFLIPLFFSAQFAESVFPFRILCIALTFAGIRALYYAVYTGYDMTRQLSLVSLILAGTNIAADLILVPVFGITGAAVGTVIAFALAAFLDMHFCQKRLHVKQKSQMLLVLPALVYVVVIAFGVPVLVEAVLAPAMLIVSVLAARFFGLVSTKHLDLFNQVNMPRTVRSALVWTYKLLATSTKRKDVG